MMNLKQSQNKWFLKNVSWMYDFSCFRKQNFYFNFKLIWNFTLLWTLTSLQENLIDLFFSLSKTTIFSKHSTETFSMKYPSNHFKQPTNKVPVTCYYITPINTMAALYFLDTGQQCWVKTYDLIFSINCTNKLRQMKTYSTRK